jgi:hypothetical protein
VSPFGVITLFPSSETRFSQRAYDIEEFPLSLLSSLWFESFWDSHEFPNSFCLYYFITSQGEKNNGTEPQLVIFFIMQMTG